MSKNNFDPDYPKVNAGKGEILDVRWYGSRTVVMLTVTVGVVLVWYKADGYLVAYIGGAVRGDPTNDAVDIAEWGSKLEPEAARALWPERTAGKRFKGERS